MRPVALHATVMWHTYDMCSTLGTIKVNESWQATYKTCSFRQLLIGLFTQWFCSGMLWWDPCSPQDWALKMLWSQRLSERYWEADRWVHHRLESNSVRTKGRERPSVSRVCQPLIFLKVFHRCEKWERKMSAKEKFAFLHTFAHVELHKGRIALFGVPDDLRSVECIAWKQVTDEHIGTQSHTHTHTHTDQQRKAVGVMVPSGRVNDTRCKWYDRWPLAQSYEGLLCLRLDYDSLLFAVSRHCVHLHTSARRGHSWIRSLL